MPARDAIEAARGKIERFRAAASVPRDEALILNLEEQPLLGIKRSLKPVHLPQAALNYLSPRKRVSYFFEQTVPQSSEGVAA